MEKNMEMDRKTLLEAAHARHSVRQYTDRAIEPEKRADLSDFIAQINAKAGTHIQILYDEPRCFDSLMAHYGKFTGVKNYIALVGKKSADLDRTQGYWGEAVVLYAQALGLNSCWVAMTHGKSRAVVAPGEKQVCLIALGYGSTQGTAHTSKPVSELSSGENVPDWFRSGIETAQLAPTAMNQQKFWFSFEPDGKVKSISGSGFYTKLDLGIAQYHFELGSGKKISG